MSRAIFLSASVPDERRDPKYHLTADRSAIRDAVKALVTVCGAETTLVWGGHPAITPLVRVVLMNLGTITTAKVKLFQSTYFQNVLPEDNMSFESVTYIAAVDGSREESLLKMRRAMLASERFEAGVFIGGMEGVEAEYDLFRDMHPRAAVLPIASSGAAAQILYDRDRSLFQEELNSDLAYASLFRKLLSRKLTE